MRGSILKMVRRNFENITFLVMSRKELSFSRSFQAGLSLSRFLPSMGFHPPWAHYDMSFHNYCSLIIPWAFILLKVHAWAFILLKLHAWAFILPKLHAWAFILLKVHACAFILLKLHAWAFILLKHHA